MGNQEITSHQNKINIAIFSLAYFPFVGGAEVAIKEITDRINKGFVFDCFTYKFNRSWQSEEIIGNIAVHRLGKGKDSTKSYYGNNLAKLAYIWRAWRAAERIHKQYPFLIIWAMMASYGGLVALLFKLRHPNIPFLLTIQEGDSEAHILRRVGIFYPLWKMIFKRADYVQVISNYLGEFARRHGAVAPIEVIPNGVDIANRKSQIANRRISKKGKIIITTSRLVHKNGIDILIRAIAELKKLNIKCQILGSGPDETKLKKLANDLGVSRAVEFVGHVPPENVADYLKEADIFVRASRSEGLGNSFLEAMLAKLPVIGTPVGGIPDFLKDPNYVGLKSATGLFCRVDDVKDLAKKIEVLLNNDELRKTIIKNGYKLVNTSYSWDLISDKMKKIFIKINRSTL